ncbi:MAG TPA: hypothetical protein VF796_12135 [Humisphaera sp.]
MSANRQRPRPAPPEFAYLEQVLDRYTYWARDNPDYAGRAKVLTPAELAELATAYEEIDRRGDVAALSAWSRREDAALSEQCEAFHTESDARVARGEPPLPSDQFPPVEPAFRLFLMFDALARRRVPPFDSRRVAYVEAPRVPDWSKLPPPLAWLREPVLRYVDYYARSFREPRRVPPDLRPELTRLAERLTWTGEWKLALKWLAEAPVDPEHRAEAELVSQFLQLLIRGARLPARRCEEETTADWSNLPPRLAYLAAPAEAYAAYDSEEARVRLMVDIVNTQADEGIDVDPRYAELQSLARWTRRDEERRLIGAWLDEHPPERFPPAAWVVSLMVLLDDFFADVDLR